MRKKRNKVTAQIEVCYKEIEIRKTDIASKGVASSIKLNLIEAKEVNYNRSDKICWRLLTTINISPIK